MLTRTCVGVEWHRSHLDGIQKVTVLVGGMLMRGNQCLDSDGALIS